MKKSLIIEKLGMYESKCFEKECVPICNNEMEDDCLGSSVDFLCLTEDLRFNRLQLEYLRPYVWINKESNSVFYGWMREDQRRILANYHNPIPGWENEEKVLGFILPHKEVLTFD